MRNDNSLPLLKVLEKKRIASGSGTNVQDINQLLKMFSQMQTGMKRLKNKKGSASIKSMLNDFRG